MSNLSDLLPSGAGGKSFDFVASGTLASGVTVGLRSDGKVEAIAGVTQVLGAKAAVASTTLGYYNETAFDSVNNKIVLIYSECQVFHIACWSPKLANLRRLQVGRL